MVKLFFSHRVKMVATRGKNRGCKQTLESSELSSSFPKIVPKGSDWNPKWKFRFPICNRFPKLSPRCEKWSNRAASKNLTLLNIFSLQMMDPDGSNGDPEAEPMCHNWDPNGDPSVKMRNNYAIITPSSSHRLHAFATEMRNSGEKEKCWENRRRSLSNPEQLI